MSYSVSLIQGPPSNYVVQIADDYQNFPRPFRNLLYRMTGCFGSGTAQGVNLDNLVALGGIQVNFASVRVRLLPAVGEAAVIDATYNYTASNVLQHVLVSVDGVAQIAQVYINDAPLTLSSGGWTGPPSQFDISGLGYNQWTLDSSGSGAPGPGVGDVYVAAPASFFDLSVTANRRKFINADLTPVDLGATATGPLGVAPQIWLTARSGVADNFKNNAGSGGGVYTIGVPPLAFQPAGVCVAPSSPTPPPATPSLAMDNVVATYQVPANTAGSQIFLDWSDDRGHRFGNPVGQPIGAPGAYLTSLQWQRLGYARDRVFRVTWSVPVQTALQGAWIEAENADSPPPQGTPSS